MKKALALVLALVLALSLGVSAFAAVDVVTLKKASSSSSVSLKEVEKLDFDALGDSVVVAGEGGTYYIQLNNKDYKDITVSATGAVSAKVVEYDPTVFEATPEIAYFVYDRTTGNALSTTDNIKGTEAQTVLYNIFMDADNHSGKYGWDDANACLTEIRTGYAFNFEFADGVKLVKYSAEPQKLADGTVRKFADDYAYSYTLKNGKEVKGVVEKDSPVYKQKVEVVASYADASAVADILNIAAGTTKYAVKTRDNTTLIELTVEDNYTAAYKEGSVKINAKLNRQSYSKTLTVIRDVTIWDYETVKWAAKYGKELSVATDNGYSDYKTALYGYATADLSKVSVENNPTVVSTTAFRAIKGEDLVVNATADLEVAIYDVAEGQKGVNFSADEVHYEYNVKDYPPSGVKSISFGFLGNQVIASDFEIDVNLDMTYFGLRESFGKKVEEEDVVTYYILKDGKEFSKFTVDYMKVDPSDKVEIEINGKAGENLGYYDIVLEVPAAPEAPAEENPNTGAESVIGVVAAMAVVSVAAAAAVSLKK